MLTTIFCETDDFCKKLEKQTSMIKIENNSRKRNRKSNLSLSEVLTIIIYFNHSGYKTFKDYYTKHVLKYMQNDFHNLVSYNRFIELKQQAAIPLMLFSQLKAKSQCTGISFVDSFPVKVCHNKRIYSHKVCKGAAQRGKTSVGWFYGFKVHFIINPFGEIIDFYITPGNVSDNNEKVVNSITKSVFGKMFGDKGYLMNEDLFKKLYSRGLQVVTKIRKNMKNKLMAMEDKLLLRKRGLVESVIAVLKEQLSIEHTRHRSKTGLLVHLCAAIVAYSFLPKKPSIVRSDNAIESYA